MRLNHVILILVAALLACNPKPSASSTTTPMPNNKTPYKNDNPFINGPSLDQGDKVYAWAESMQQHPDGTKRRFRMPVYVDRSPQAGVLNPLRYFAGVEKGGPDKNILEIRLDDGRLGISLADRISQFCPETDQACIIQIEATWGPLMEAISAMRDDRPVFAINNVTEFTADPSPGNGSFFISAEQ